MSSVLPSAKSLAAISSLDAAEEKNSHGVKNFSFGVIDFRFSTSLYW